MAEILNAPPHVYGTFAPDRAADRRRDEAWLALRRADPSTRVVRMAGLLVPIRGAGTDAPRLDAPRVAERAEGDAAPGAIFLGLHEDAALFAELAGPESAEDGRHVELRTVGTLLPAAEAAILAYARALAHWHATHGFCPNCGTATEVVQGGHVRRCPACGLDQFPRSDPAVIVLVTRGDSCLLGRSPRFPPGMYSTLAGFVEPGESLEETLHREILEEVGVRIESTSYRSSQPWPFPQSLMLGFRATTSDERLTIDRDEIEDARWLTRAELKDPARRPVRLPGGDSIARFLLEEWLAEEG